MEKLKDWLSSDDFLIGSMSLLMLAIPVSIVLAN
jgi:hypothetical protein